MNKTYRSKSSDIDQLKVDIHHQINELLSIKSPKRGMSPYSDGKIRKQDLLKRIDILHDAYINTLDLLNAQNSEIEHLYLSQKQNDNILHDLNVLDRDLQESLQQVATSIKKLKEDITTTDRHRRDAIESVQLDYNQHLIDSHPPIESDLKSLHSISDQLQKELDDMKKDTEFLTLADQQTKQQMKELRNHITSSLDSTRHEMNNRMAEIILKPVKETEDDLRYLKLSVKQNDEGLFQLRSKVNEVEKKVDEQHEPLSTLETRIKHQLHLLEMDNRQLMHLLRQHLKDSPATESIQSIKQETPQKLNPKQRDEIVDAVRITLKDELKDHITNVIREHTIDQKDFQFTLNQINTRLDAYQESLNLVKKGLSTVLKKTLQSQELSRYDRAANTLKDISLGFTKELDSSVNLSDLKRI